MSTRIIGIDYGQKRMGLAISDVNHLIASPLATFEAQKNMDTLVDYLKKVEIDKNFTLENIVIGLPLHMDGKESKMSEEVKIFGHKLEEKLCIKIHFFDERLSSVQAERFLKEANFSRKKRTQFVDKLSAVLVLQSFLDSRSQDRVN